MEKQDESRRPAGGRETEPGVSETLCREEGSADRMDQDKAADLEKKRYDALFQSVLCGIVQYRIDENGIVVFKNANREAIRIFGYEEREFWQIRDWDIRGLIDPEDREKGLIEVSGLKDVGDKVFYEYRVLQKDGNSCWIIGTAEVIRDIDGELIVQSVFMDEDKRKRAERQNKLLEQRVEAGNELLKLSLEHTSIYEFYYDIRTRTGRLPRRTRAAYHGCGGVYENMAVSFADDFLAPEYAGRYEEMFEKIHSGAGTAAGEFLSRDRGTWQRITISTVDWDEDGPVFAVGIVEDITKEKEMEAALLDARTRDSLTGLYTKDAGIELVRRHLSDKPAGMVCAMMILDIDDFEEINVRQGSIFADAVLQEVADILRSETGERDILIRLGGDEFMLYIKDCDKARATVLGPLIAEKIRMLRVEGEFRVSASIGMCVTAVVDDYSGLYRCAESTLLYVKEHERGKAACYLDTSNELGTMLTKLYPGNVLINEIDTMGNLKKEDIISFALELLSKAKRLEDAIGLLLIRIGRQFSFDRIMIFEANAEYQMLTCAYQWSAQGIPRFEDRNIYLSRLGLWQLSTMYEGEESCESMIAPDGRFLPGILHAAFWDEGNYAGALTFEVRKKGYRWTDQEKSAVKELAKIISSFILRVRADAVSQAKTDFLSRMSHEIRTPMNAIAGMTAIAKTVLDNRERALDCLEKIEKANAYLLQLVNDILDMSRIESGMVELNLEDVDLHEMASDLMDMMKPQAEKKEIELRLSDGYRDKRLLVADALRLNQVLVNIVGNAVKFTPRGGKVIICIDQQSVCSGTVSLRFSVKDNGIGISSHRQKSIFNAFEQADKTTASRYGGTGLGLAISSRLVQMLGGKLEVKSEIGEGSEFFFTLCLPFGGEASEVGNKKEEASGEIRFDGRRILVVEDNEMNREIAVTILGMKGFETEEAGDGLKALDLYTGRPAGYYDLILMDIQMPVMDGLTATRAIRTSGREDARTVPIVALTANAFDLDTKKSMESGMNGHLVKPIEVDRLVELLAQCLS